MVGMSGIVVKLKMNQNHLATYQNGYVSYSIVMLKMNQNHFASMQNGCYVSYSYVENEPKSLSNHTEWLYPVLWIRIRICMDPELLPGSGSSKK